MIPLYNTLHYDQPYSKTLDSKKLNNIGASIQRATIHSDPIDSD
jgi:hypothetical protein